MLIRISLLLYLLGLESTALAQSRPKIFVVDDHFESTTLFGSLSLFTDSSGRVNINSWLSNTTNRPVFKPVKNEILNLGFDPHYHWIKCQISNAGSKTQELVFGLDFFHVDAISFYIVDEANTIIYRQERLSRRTPIASRPIAVRNFAFPVIIKPDQTLTLYCQVFRKHSVLLLPFKLFTKKAFLENGFSFDFLFLLGIGVLLIAFLTSFLLFLATRKWVLLYYSLYVLSYCGALLSLEGVWSHYISTIPFLDENTHLVMLGVGTYAQLNFTVDFLQLTQLAKKWLIAIRLVALFALLIGFYVLVTPFSYANASLISVLGIGTEVIILTLVVIGLISQKYEAILYLAGFLPFFVAMTWLATNVFANVERTWLFYQLGYTIPFAQLVILGVGLGLKLIREREQSVTAIGLMKQQQAESIIQAQETERQRLAADLHDDLGGTLATLHRRLTDLRQYLHDPETVCRFDALQPLIQKSGTDLRRIAHNLMPPEFARTGLRIALHQLVRSQPAQPTDFSFVMSGTEYKLPLAIELNAYRIVSELIQNIGKHAQAQRAAVQLLYHTDHLTITVEDDGLGARSVRTADDHTGIGLKNTSLRAEYIGATLWRDVSEVGTLVVLDIPYPASVYAARITQPYPAN